MRYRFLLALFASISAFAEPPILSSYLFTPKDKAILDQVALDYEITHRHGEAFEILVPVTKSAEFLKKVPDAKLLEADTSAIFKQIANRPDWLADYHNFSTVQDHLNRIAQQHPDIAKLEVYGKSAEGRNLYALKISDNVDQDESEIEVMLTAATHGDELISVEVVMGIVDSLIDGYGKDPRMTRFVEEREIYVVPVVNPDGYTRQSRYTSNGTDPNRDYPWPEQPDRKPVPCIREIMKFFNDHQIVGSMDFHASGQMIMYPWAYTYDPVESFYDRIMGELVKNMANWNHYANGPISKTIYVAKGSSADYYFWKKETIALAVEIGTSKVPHSSAIPQMLKENLEPTWRFMEHF